MKHLTWHASGANDEIKLFFRGIFDRHVRHDLQKEIAQRQKKTVRDLPCTCGKSLPTEQKEQPSPSNRIESNRLDSNARTRTHLDPPAHLAQEPAFRHDRRRGDLGSEPGQRIGDARRLDFFGPIGDGNQHAFRHVQGRSCSCCGSVGSVVKAWWEATRRRETLDSFSERKKCRSNDPHDKTQEKRIG